MINVHLYWKICQLVWGCLPGLELCVWWKVQTEQFVCPVDTHCSNPTCDLCRMSGHDTAADRWKNAEVQSDTWAGHSQRDRSSLCSCSWRVRGGLMRNSFHLLSGMNSGAEPRQHFLSGCAQILLLPLGLTDQNMTSVLTPTLHVTNWAMERVVGGMLHETLRTWQSLILMEEW